MNITLPHMKINSKYFKHQIRFILTQLEIAGLDWSQQLVRYWHNTIHQHRHLLAAQYWHTLTRLSGSVHRQ